MSMVPVRSIMVPISKCPTVHSDEPAREAFKTLKQYAEVPWLVNKPLIVVDDTDQMIGLITLKGLLRHIDFDDASTKMENSVESWKDFFEWEQKQWAEQPVAEVMRPLTEVCVDADMPVPRNCYSKKT